MVSIYFIRPTANFEICIDDPTGGKEGLEARLQPKGAGSLSRSLHYRRLLRGARRCARLSGVCAHTWVHFRDAPVQQKAFLGSDPMGLLQSWSFAWEPVGESGVSREAVVRAALRAQVGCADGRHQVCTDSAEMLHGFGAALVGPGLMGGSG